MSKTGEEYRKGLEDSIVARKSEHRLKEVTSWWVLGGGKHVDEVEQEDEDLKMKRSARQKEEHKIEVSVLKKGKRTKTEMIEDDANQIEVGERQVNARLKTI